MNRYIYKYFLVIFASLFSRSIVKFAPIKCSVCIVTEVCVPGGSGAFVIASADLMRDILKAKQLIDL